MNVGVLVVQMAEQSENVSLTKKYTYGTWRAQKGWIPLEVVDADGCFFADVSGKRFLDFSSQLMCCNLGHKNRRVIDAICEQARKLPYIQPAYTTEVRAKLSKELLEVMPEGLEKFFYATSGTEANEAAFRIARQYTGKYKIISRYTSYHGSTAGSIAATGDPRRYFNEPAGKVDGVIFGPDAYCYRCPFGLDYPDCGIACADYVEYMIEHESNVAAVIVEPVVGTNGVIVPPDGYLPRLREITRKRGVLLICDEVMTGWGRTGKWFAVDNWDVKPDILTTAKGISAAYVPVSIAATTGEIAEFFEEHYFPLGHTYEAHPLTLSAGVAAIQEYKRLGLIERSTKMGRYLGERLRALQDKHTSIGDVRGLGMFWGIELVRDRKLRTPFSTREDKVRSRPMMVDRVAADCMNDGVYVNSWINCLIIAPPLIIKKEEIDQGVAAIDKALTVADKEIS